MVVICFSLVVVGGYFRLYRLGEMSLWMDEAFSVQVARAIQQNGTPWLETGERVASWLPAHYLMAGSLAAFPEMHWASRLPFALAGTLLVGLAGVLAYQLTRSRWATVLMAFYMALSVPDIAWSRQARGYALVQLLGVAAIVLVLAGQSRHRAWNWIAAGLLLALAVLTHRAGYMYALICLGIVAADFLPGRTRGVARPRLSPGDRLGIFGLAGLPLLAGLMLPLGASQGLAETVMSLELLQEKPSYIVNYFLLVFDFWQWNTVWMAAGTVVLLTREWRKTVPVFIGVAAYLFILSEKNLWFHVRYLMPITPFLHLAVATAMGRGTEWILSCNRSRVWKGLLVSAAFLAWGATSLTQNLTFVPDSEYVLGPTEPQADWRGAFQWLKRHDSAPVTVMTLPVFHDLYLGSDVGTKRFLPFTFSSVPGEWQIKAPYSVALPIRSAAELETMAGYVILDAFSFRKLRDPEIQQCLADHSPVHVTPDGSVQIWRLPLTPL